MKTIPTNQADPSASETIICSFCFGVIRGQPDWRGARPYHRAAGPIWSARRGGCASADRLIVARPAPSRAHQDQLRLEEVTDD